MTKRALFSGTYDTYRTFRPGIPERVIDRILEETGTTPGDRVLDVGCGTGQVALALDGKCREIVCVDADARMLAQAREAAGQPGSETRISWLHAAAEDLLNLRDQLGVFSLATFCRSFHWMRPASVLEALETLLVPRGSLAICGDGSLWTGREPWQQTVRTIIQDYLGPERRAGSGFFRIAQTPWKNVLRQSPFSQCREYALELTRSWDVGSILGYLASTSYASPELFGEQLGPFQEDVAAALLALQPSGRFSEAAVFYLVVASRKKTGSCA